MASTARDIEYTFGREKVEEHDRLKRIEDKLEALEDLVREILTRPPTPLPPYTPPTPYRPWEPPYRPQEPYKWDRPYNPYKVTVSTSCGTCGADPNYCGHVIWRNEAHDDGS